MTVLEGASQRVITKRIITSNQGNNTRNLLHIQTNNHTAHILYCIPQSALLFTMHIPHYSIVLSSCSILSYIFSCFRLLCRRIHEYYIYVIYFYIIFDPKCIPTTSYSIKAEGVFSTKSTFLLYTGYTQRLAGSRTLGSMTQGWSTLAGLRTLHVHWFLGARRPLVRGRI